MRLRRALIAATGRRVGCGSIGVCRRTRCCPGTPRPMRRDVPGVGKRVMSTPISARMISALRCWMPGIVVQQFPGRPERDHHLLDPWRRAGRSPRRGSRRERADLGDHPGVVVVEPARHALAEITDLGAQPALGHLGQHLRVAFASAQCVEDHPAGHARARRTRPMTASRWRPRGPSAGVGFRGQRSSVS